MKKGWILVFLFVLGGVWRYVQEDQGVEIADVSSEQAHELVMAAKEQIGIVKAYDHSNGYYGDGGFPPEDVGVCTDVIWRAYRDVGLDFKSSIIAHQQAHPDLYENFGDDNISFRRVKNINTYLTHTADVLTTELVLGDEANLAMWQAGDIVVFDALPPKNLWHIAIISDHRRSDGVPYMIDNHGYGVKENITPLDRSTAIVGHYRVF